MTTSTSDGGIDAADIQGNIVGFNKDLQRLLFVSFPDQPSTQRFMAGMADEVNHADEVRAFNKRFKVRQLAGEDQLSEQTSWVNLGISFTGLTQLGAPGTDTFPAEFKAGMRARAAQLGDVEASDPNNWTGPFAPASGFAVHALVIIGADSQDLLDQRTAAVRTVISSSGVQEFTAAQDGHTRPAPFRGHEHFGFKDGISQPSIRGLTRSSKGGDDIASGEILIGYEDEDGNVSGQAVTQPPPPIPAGQPGYPGTTTPTTEPMPDWTKNGSFFVFRKLFQDVGGFQQFTQSQASGVQLTPEQLRARLVGRWPSGAPLQNVPGDRGADTLTSDPSVDHPSVLEDEHINNFGYAEHDVDGHLTPRAAHIRKSYPRDEQPPGREEANRHRILRRGIPYGPEFVPTEPAYGGGPVADGQDRGLLFICYQSSIERGFEFVQTSWANQPDFPDPGDGEDPIISQNVTATPFPLPDNPHFTTPRWVITTGGDYFFAPSLSAIRQLGGQASP